MNTLTEKYRKDVYIYMEYSYIVTNYIRSVLVKAVSISMSHPKSSMNENELLTSESMEWLIEIKK